MKTRKVLGIVSIAVIGTALIAPGLGTSVAKKKRAAGIKISLGESGSKFYLKPAKKTGKAGKVNFIVKNKGKLPHEVVWIKTDTLAADLPVKGNEADETGKVKESKVLTPGKSQTVKVKLVAGHYALICNLPTHYQAGQYADFNVK